MSDAIDWPSLIDLAWRVRAEAYAPYSQYRVGAALLSQDGRVFAGCNVENASYGLCLCAERAAIGTAIAAGARRFRAIAVVTGGEEPGSPCGMCRQVLCEFAPSFPVRCVAESGLTLESTTEALLPFAFTPRALGIEPSAEDPMRSTMVMGTSSDTDRPPPPLTALAGVALKVVAGGISEITASDVTHIEADVDRRNE